MNSATSAGLCFVFFVISPRSVMNIRILSPELQQKIAAGEVIERPASAVNWLTPARRGPHNSTFTESVRLASFRERRNNIQNSSKRSTSVNTA